MTLQHMANDKSQLREMLNLDEFSDSAQVSKWYTLMVLPAAD